AVSYWLAREQGGGESLTAVLLYHAALLYVPMGTTCSRRSVREQEPTTSSVRSVGEEESLSTINAAGHSQCLDAFSIALNQACVGEQLWYTSTRELQLVSTPFCCACRSIPALFVRVEEETPRSLWD
ncbi:unnamed protein product, partial [Ectocarpus fasciculatus]